MSAAPWLESDAPVRSLEQQIECIEREISMRRKVYPRWVVTSRMTEEAARHEMAAMRGVLDTLKALHERREPELF